MMAKQLRFWTGWWDENAPGNHRHMALNGTCYITEAEERENPGMTWPYSADLQKVSLDSLLFSLTRSARLRSYTLVKEEISENHAMLRYEKRNTRRGVLAVRQFELTVEEVAS